MRVATWNTEWAAISSKRGLRVKERITEVDNEIWVITEGSADLLHADGYVIDAGNDWGYETEGERRKVLAWSRTPWREVTTVEEGAGRGRVVTGITNTSLGAIEVVAVCIPWRDCHVRTGRRDATPWAEHLECCVQIAELLQQRGGDVPTIVLGDFNQRIPRHRQPTHVAAALDHTLNGLTVHTSGETECGRLIDHIATSAHLVPTRIQVWAGNDKDERLSDHGGVAVDFRLR